VLGGTCEEHVVLLTNRAVFVFVSQKEKLFMTGSNLPNKPTPVQKVMKKQTYLH